MEIRIELMRYEDETVQSIEVVKYFVNHLFDLISLNGNGAQLVLEGWTFWIFTSVMETGRARQAI